MTKSASNLSIHDIPIHGLIDNGSIYTALETRCTAERLHLVPIGPNGLLLA